MKTKIESEYEQQVTEWIEEGPKPKPEKRCRHDNRPPTPPTWKKILN